ncbi:MAG: saccharopine dehydrogenase family protein [Spirochaetales bacterium]|nr:saccharopine dehydrogenase family protein [Spirochaetales bacterium]
MGKVLIIGAGGVGGVVTHKCAMNGDTFNDIHLASRTIEKCGIIQKQVKNKTKARITIHTLDADNVRETVSLLNHVKPDLVINVALPYQDLSIMDACLETGIDYMDTANYEPRDVAKFEYKWQWDYHDRFKQKGIMALLGSGFDPGVTNVFSAYALKHHFDVIKTIDILDCNAGSHGKAFATNFNPEINIREVTQAARHWEKGQWIETPPIIEEGAVHFTFDYPVAGKQESYLLYHEELESLVKNIKGLERIRFWMTFSDNYLTHLKVLQNVGMTGIKPVNYKGMEIVPIQFLKAVLPEPSSLGKNYTGKTVIGNVMTGVKDGKEKGLYIFNVCDHAECFREVNAQAISYTTGVPAMIGAKLILSGKWNGKGVFNMEEMDPDPFMDELNKQGLPWQMKDFPHSL